jgi:hypothetical protein
MWYHWIYKEKPEWALKEVEDWRHRACDDLYAKERGRDDVARAKAEREKAKKHREEQ